uniref:Uncharacterized protein n=2 Tax=Ditylum brightwellii TaxID=49249 RepID=A0A7S4V868_9STRA
MSNFGSAFSSFTNPESTQTIDRVHSAKPYPSSSSNYRHHSEKRSVSFHSTDTVCNYDATQVNHQPYHTYNSNPPYHPPIMRSPLRRSFSPTPSHRRNPPASHFQDDDYDPNPSKRHHSSQDKAAYLTENYQPTSIFHRDEKPIAPQVTSSAVLPHGNHDQGSSMPSPGQSSSLLSQVAQRILSFDSSSVATHATSKTSKNCGSSGNHNAIDKEDEEFKLMPPPQHKRQHHRSHHQNQQGTSEEHQNTAEEEGTEVALVDLMECEEEEDIRTPPPESPVMDGKPQVEIDWSSKVGGCHTWLHESFTGGVGSLPGIVQCGTENGKHADHLSPVHSIEMDCYSLTGTDVYSQGGSLNGSVGGGSLCNVFDADAMSGNGSSHGAASLLMQDNQSTGTHRPPLERSPQLSAPYHQQRSEHCIPQVSKRGVLNSASKEGGSLPPIAYSQDSEPFEPSNEKIEPMNDFMWSWDGKSRE